MNFTSVDIIIFFIYCSIILFIGILASGRGKKKEKKETANDYFLASKSLPWWVIGSSVIASNISAEQFIGMSGSGYAIGLGIATYEWLGAIGLLLVAKYFLPIYLKKGIFTMPQFLEIRYDKRVRTSLAVFWLLVYIFVNLTSVLYLGALALQTIMGVKLIYAIIGLVIFSGAYTIYGGLKAIAWTDVFQVVFLVVGGLLTTFFALDALGDGGILSGFTVLLESAPDKFNMILDPSNEYYQYLPGIWVLLTGIWVANLNYFGCNQYIIQRALAAKSLKEAQYGMAFAGYLKIIMPLIVVIPGIVAFVLHADIAKSDEAYPWLLNSFVPTGIKGLAFAALIAAVVSSLSSMANSTSTIFVMDIYKPIINKKADETRLVLYGRVASGVALLIAGIVAPSLANIDQAFQFIQDFTGLISPGIVAIFLLGLFWKRATPGAALWAVIATIPVSFIIDNYLLPNMPFLNRMGITFLVISLLIIVLSLIEKRHSTKGLTINKTLFHTNIKFNIASLGIMAILSILYTLFW